MSSAVVAGSLLMGICFLLDVVGVATDYWFVFGTIHSGLFKVCIADDCGTYIERDDTFLNVHYLDTTGCSCLGCLLLFITVLIGLFGCHKPYAKPVVQNIGGLGLTAGIFGTIGFIWYYLYFFQGTFGNGRVLLSTFGVPGWSFYLSAVASGLTLILGITFIISAGNMPAQGGAVVPQQQQTVVAMQNQQSQMQPSAPPPQQMYY